MSDNDRPRPVRYYAIGQAIGFALFFGLFVGMIGVIAYLVEWIELELPLKDSLIIWMTLGLTLGFMRGLGTGYAHNHQYKDQHIVIIGSGFILSMLMLLALTYSFSLYELQINRDGVIGFTLGVTFFGSLLICLAYSQKREDLKSLRAKATE